ncbi:MAG: TIM barrel protein [Planctomycetota bacterium]
MLNSKSNADTVTGTHQSRSLCTRRQAVSGSIAAMGVAAVGGQISQAASIVDPQSEDGGNVKRHGHIRQSVMGWCFKPMGAVELARIGKQLGLVAIEGIDAKHYPEVRKLGLDISLVGSHGFKNGPVSTDNHAEVESKLRSSIDTAVQFDAKRVITFTGMSVAGMSEATAKKNCIDCWKRVIGYAEEKGITLCLEHLNSRDDSHPMKGHPGYFGDDVDQCVDLIREVDSPNLKLLFDIYHVQVMHGDVIRRLRSIHPYIGHYHTAGNPGRCEIDEHQEINYPPILQAILETGFNGFVAQEFIPTWDEPMESLKHAIGVCDIASA